MTIDTAALLERLRNARANGDPAKYLAGISVAEAHAVAALITELEATREALREAREALEPFVSALLDYGDTVDDRREYLDSENIWDHPVAMSIDFGDLRRARSTLEGQPA